MWQPKPLHVAITAANAAFNNVSRAISFLSTPPDPRDKGIRTEVLWEGVHAVGKVVDEIRIDRTCHDKTITLQALQQIYTSGFVPWMDILFNELRSAEGIATRQEGSLHQNIIWILVAAFLTLATAGKMYSLPASALDVDDAIFFLQSSPELVPLLIAFWLFTIRAGHESLELMNRAVYKLYTATWSAKADPQLHILFLEHIAYTPKAVRSLLKHIVSESEKPIVRFDELKASLVIIQGITSHSAGTMREFLIANGIRRLCCAFQNLVFPDKTQNLRAFGDKLVAEICFRYLVLSLSGAWLYGHAAIQISLRNGFLVSAFGTIGHMHFDIWKTGSMWGQAGSLGEIYSGMLSMLKPAMIYPSVTQFILKSWRRIEDTEHGRMLTNLFMEASVNSRDPSCTINNSSEQAQAEYNLYQFLVLWKDILDRATTFDCLQVTFLAESWYRRSSSCSFSECSDEQELDRIGSRRRCSGCKSAYYCSENCQRRDWRLHKKSCKEIQSCIEFYRLPPPITNPDQAFFKAIIKQTLLERLPKDDVNSDPQVVYLDFRRIPCTILCTDVGSLQHNASSEPSGEIKIGDILDIENILENPSTRTVVFALFDGYGSPKRGLASPVKIIVDPDVIPLEM